MPPYSQIQQSKSEQHPFKEVKKTRKQKTPLNSVPQISKDSILKFICKDGLTVQSALKIRKIITN